MRKIRTTSRLFEQILGVLGSFLCLISGSISSYYVNKHVEAAGIGFVLAAILVLIGTPHLAKICSIVLLIAGISALFRK